MVSSFGNKGQAQLLALADRVVTLPFVQWTWTGLGDANFPAILSEIRPTDVDSVPEMMAGRYLLASKLAVTDGASPFSVPPVSRLWHQELHGFSWLRHFRDVRDEGQRRFARTLVLDWIGRHGRFDHDVWSLSLTAQRVMNWLRHFDVLTAGADANQTARVGRALATQIQSLRVRSRFAATPIDYLMARIALLGAALCDGSEQDIVRGRLAKLLDALELQIDQDGLHKSRNPDRQIQLLGELATLRMSLAKRQLVEQNQFGVLVDKMHGALASLTLGSGEAGYFNGCGQQQADVVFALQALGDFQRKVNAAVSGYGILKAGNAYIIADSGYVPDPEYSLNAHAGALSVEFSHGNELIFGNCGPAPAQLADSADLFRMGAAHSAPTISGQSAAWIRQSGGHKGHLVSDGRVAQVELDAEDVALKLSNDGFVEPFGVRLERRLTLLSDGDTLVGQDLFLGEGRQVKEGVVSLRFHLGPGVSVQQAGGEDIYQITLPSGAEWSFLFEGNGARIEDSVRQSAHFGFYQTKQIVVETPLRDGIEVAWILTRVS